MIFIASDYKGISLRKEILSNPSYSYEDIGIFDGSPLDYIDVSKELSIKMMQNKSSYGVIICGSGQGVCVALNRYAYIRAVVCKTIEDALNARQKLNANVLCIGSENTTKEQAEQIINAFLETEFKGGKHESCVRKLATHATNHVEKGINIIARAIIIHENHVLFTTVTDENKEFAKNLYFLPGGHVDYEESTIDAIYREIYEEMNLNVNKCTFAGALECTWDRKGKPYHEINIVYLVDIDGLSLKNPPKPMDHGFHKFVWMPLEKVRNITILPSSLKKIIENASHQTATFYSEMAK